MKKTVMTTILLSSLSISSISFAAQGAKKEIIRFATEATYAPFESLNSKNEIVGFDIDIANALCKKINAQCTFTHQAFDSLIPSLKYKRFDALIAGIDITPERKKQVDFSDVYYGKFGAKYVSVKGKITAIDQLKGKKIGVQNGTTHQKYLAATQKDTSIIPYDSYQNAILDLKNGRIDAVYGDGVVADDWLKTKGNEKLAQLGEKVTDPTFYGVGLGIAVRKGNANLLEQLNSALKGIQADGTYNEIYKKWFKN